MSTHRAQSASSRRPVITAVIAAACLLGVLPAAQADQPEVPIPLPFFSLDRESPAVEGGLVMAADVLTLEFGQLQPAVDGFAIGLPQPADDLDALSGPNVGVMFEQPLHLLISVDRMSVGTVLPDPLLVELGVPYNVADQAERGHAAGDQYASHADFILIIPPLERGDRFANNTLVRNNYDEGGTDFGAMPPTGADGTVTNDPQDNVDGTANLEDDGTARRIVNVYFTATADSPSLDTLPHEGDPSGASIFVNPNPLDWRTTELYASAGDLGLLPMDDIDAMVVFETGIIGEFDAEDTVLFSLTPESPSLTLIPGASDVGAGADIFVARAQHPASIFASAQVLGLGAPLDNVDALEFFHCPDHYVDCMLRHGIRALRGDCNCDSVVDFADIDCFVQALIGQASWPYPDCAWIRSDCNYDGTVNFDDIDAFVTRLAGGH